MYDQLAQTQALAPSYPGNANPRRPTQREQLTERKAALTEQLHKVTHALEMLDKYPDFEEVMNAVIQANY